MISETSERLIILILFMLHHDFSQLFQTCCFFHRVALIEPEETQGPGGQTSQAAAAAGFLYCELGAGEKMMSSSPATCE